jgi:hypothetical protein
MKTSRQRRLTLAALIGMAFRKLDRRITLG